MNTQGNLLPHKGAIISEMFLHTADENYITACWCHDNGLMTDFFWNSVHALEKYSKAALLYNEQSVKEFSHKLADLYEELYKLAGPLLPQNLTQPANLKIEKWQNSAPLEFMKALDRNGNADNRYLTFGYAQHPWYIHKVDSMVWAIRRLALPLDEPISNQAQFSSAPTYQSVLTKQPEYAFRRNLPLEELVRGQDTDARRALLNNNCAFAPDDFQHEPRRTGFSSRNPILRLSIIEPLESDREEKAREGYQIGLWLLKNMKLSKPVRNEINVAMKAALTKHPSIDNPNFSLSLLKC